MGKDMDFSVFTKSGHITVLFWVHMPSEFQGLNPSAGHLGKLKDV